MKKTLEYFTIDYNNSTIGIEVLSIDGRVLYNVNFADRPPVFLAKAVTISGRSLWTSVPEGRQSIAIEIGALIDEYLSVK